MKTTISMLALAAALTAFAAPALAAEQPAAATTPVFGFVDVSKVLQTTDAAKDILAQMDVKYKEYQAKIKKEEDSLRDMETSLAKEKDTLSKEAFQEKYKVLQEKFSKEQKMVQDSKRTFDKALSTAMNQLRAEAATVVKGLAEEKHYAAVFTQDAMIVSVPELDMTSEVIARLNKNVKKISVDWAAAAADTKK